MMTESFFFFFLTRLRFPRGPSSAFDCLIFTNNKGIAFLDDSVIHLEFIFPVWEPGHFSLQIPKKYMFHFLKENGTFLPLPFWMHTSLSEWLIE